MNIGENLKDKKIILTGGSRGIGLSILDKLYAFESKVLVIGSNNKNLLTAKEKYPNIKIAGVFNPEILDVDELTLKYHSFFNDVDTDIVWVSLGFPKQELFINNINSNNKNFVGVGAVFEWVAGTKVKAPEWIADIGFEWILRLIQEPKRLFKRYLIDNTLFIYYFLKQILK